MNQNISQPERTGKNCRSLSRRLRETLSERALALFAVIPLAAVLLLASGCQKTDGNGEPKESASKPALAATADPGQLEAVFFDVGKGDCILFSNSAGNVLLDTGYEETSDEIIRELKKRNITSLDAMIITHYDKDHVGGAAEIASAIEPSIIYLPDYIGEEEKCADLFELIDRKKLSSERVSSDLSFSLGEAEIYVDAGLIPYDKEKKNDNNASLIVEVVNGKDSWLLPGDIEEKAICVWLDGHEGDTYDVLKLPHHGRKEDSTAKLIKSVSPEIAVITDSYEDPASEKVLKKLEKHEVEVYRSSTDGTITITSDGEDHFEVVTQK